MTGQAGNRFWVGVFPGYPQRLAQLLVRGSSYLEGVKEASPRAGAVRVPLALVDRPLLSGCQSL